MIRCKVNLIYLFVLLFSSCCVTKKHEESKIYEHYIGFTHQSFSMLFNKIDSTFVYSSYFFSMGGTYSSNNDTLYLCSHKTTGSSFSLLTKDSCNCIRTMVFINKGDYIKDITTKFYNLSNTYYDPLSEISPSKLYKVKVPEIKQEKEYLKYWSGPVR